MSDHRTRIVPPEMLGGPTPMMNTRRERAAIAAMTTLRAMGADVVPTHRLANGLGFIAPDTGIAHGPYPPCRCTNPEPVPAGNCGLCGA
jgi:hypothetical protein